MAFVLPYRPSTSGSITELGDLSDKVKNATAAIRYYDGSMENLCKVGPIFLYERGRDS
jgi:hypothetical protein